MDDLLWYSHLQVPLTLLRSFAEETTLLQYRISLSDLPEDQVVFVGQNTGARYVRAGFQINLYRRLFPFVLAYFLPSFLLVQISFISFYIDPDVVPGRMALLITLVLMLINLSNSSRSEAPKVRSNSETARSLIRFQW